MPPRFAYWTIILDGAPTSFRARERDEILPLFNQLKAKNAGAELKWFSGGKLWESPDQAKEARQLERVRLFRDERRKQEREARGFAGESGREPGPEGARSPESDPLAEFRRQHGRPADGSDDASTRDGVPDDHRGRRTFSPRDRGDRPARPFAGRGPGSEPRRGPGPGGVRAPQDDPLAEFRRQHGRPADGSDQKAPPTEQSGGPTRPWSQGSSERRTSPPREWSPGSEASGPPKADRRGKGWRPRGEHKDPRDKYKLPPGQARKRWKERNLGPRPFGKKPFESRPPGAGSEGERPAGPGKPFGKKPFGQRPFSGKPSGPGGPRSFGGKPGGPGKRFGEKPSGPGGPRPFGGKPSGPGGPRSFGGKPGGPGKRFGGKPSGPGGPRSFGGKPSGPGGPRAFDRRPPRGPRRPK